MPLQCSLNLEAFTRTCKYAAQTSSFKAFLLGGHSNGIFTWPVKLPFIGKLREYVHSLQNVGIALTNFSYISCDVHGITPYLKYIAFRGYEKSIIPLEYPLTQLLQEYAT